MPEKQLQESLQALRQEVRELDVQDRDKKATIEALISDLEQQLDNPSDSSHGSRANQKLPGMIETFEVEHPQITRVLNQIMLTLSNMGI